MFFKFSKKVKFSSSREKKLLNLLGETQTRVILATPKKAQWLRKLGLDGGAVAGGAGQNGSRRLPTFRTSV